MALSLVPYSRLTGSQASRTFISVAWQPGWRVGDFVYIAARLRDTTVVPSMSGWTLEQRAVNTTTGRGHQVVVFWRQMQAGDGPTSTWSLVWGGGTITCAYAGEAIRGALVGSPVGGSAQAVSTVTVFTAPFTAPTATGPGLCVTIVANYSAGYPNNQPSGWFFGHDSNDGYCTPFNMEVPAGVVPSPAFTGTTDAWTTIAFVVLDGTTADPSYDTPLGLDGVNAVANGGWPGGYQAAVNSGANYVRAEFGTSQSDASCDAEFTEAAALGMSVLPLISNYTQISRVDKNAVAAFVAHFVSRYCRGGTFWTTRNDTHLAPTYVEILNEPWGTWFYGVVEPRDYADLFIRCATAGRIANPNAKFIIAGVDRYYQSGWQDWFGPMVTAQPTLAQYIDGVTFHLYGVAPLNLADWGTYQEWPELMSTMDDLISNKGVSLSARAWVTEWGFTTTTNTASPDFGVSQAQQAQQITAALGLFHGRWREVFAGAWLYRYRDGVTDTRENRWGIYNNDGSAKPGVAAFQAAGAAYTRGLRASRGKRYPSRRAEAHLRLPARI